MDGYESVLTPDALEQMTTIDYEALAPESELPPHAGKLILGTRWYFVFPMPANELPGLKRGDKVSITFARNFYNEIEMRVDRVGKNEAGQRLLSGSSSAVLSNHAIFD